jgi:CDP-diacylglycerol--serine O-phosphatidyltransferase
MALMVIAQERQMAKLATDTNHFSMVRALHLADYITLGNALCGINSVLFSMRYLYGPRENQGNMWIALWLMPSGLIFDFMDGKVARWRNKSSLLGQELDSLADLISFGVAPTVAAFVLGLDTPLDCVCLSFFFSCGLLRLARFNVTVQHLPKNADGKSKYFEGTPIPSTLLIEPFMALWLWFDWIREDMALGSLWTGTPFELHYVVAMFIISGCLMISKTVHFPKP